MSLLKKIYRSAVLLTLFTISTFYFSVCRADATIQQVVDAINSLWAGYGQPNYSNMKLAPFDATTSTLEMQLQSMGSSPILPAAITQNQQLLLSGIFQQPSTTTATIMANNIATFSPLSASSTDPTSQSVTNIATCNANILGGPSAITACINQALNGPLANVDINSVIAPLTYQTNNNNNQQQNAGTFINYLGQTNVPIPLVDLNQLAKAADNGKGTPVTTLITGNQAVKQYLADMRTYAIAASTGLGALNQLYAERVPGNLASANAQALGLPQNASALQVENSMATRRLNPSWASGLLNDDIASLLRQIAILQAQNLAEQYNVHMAIERLTAVMAVNTLLQNNAQRLLLINEAQNIAAPKSSSS